MFAIERQINRVLQSRLFFFCSRSGSCFVVEDQRCGGDGEVLVQVALSYLSQKVRTFG